MDSKIDQASGKEAASQCREVCQARPTESVSQPPLRIKALLKDATLSLERRILTPEVTLPLDNTLLTAPNTQVVAATQEVDQRSQQQTLDFRDSDENELSVEMYILSLRG